MSPPRKYPPPSMRQCPVCLEVKLLGSKRKTCSRQCNMRKINSNPDHQSAAGVLGGAGRNEWLATQELTGYVRNRKGGSHRHVAEEVLRRPLRPGEVVHHEDLNKRNNDPANLIVFFSQADHARHHKLSHLGSPCDCRCLRLGVMLDVL